MSRRSLFRRDDDESSQWVSVADLMAGLMIIFLFIAVAFMLKKQTSKPPIPPPPKPPVGGPIEPPLVTKIRKIAVAYRDTEQALYQELSTTFADLVDQGRVHIDRQTLTVSFRPTGRADDFFFVQGSAKVPPAFTATLKDFVPKYVSLLYGERFRNKIVEVRVEGHTSSEYRSWSGYRAYMPNLKLSHARTRSIVSEVMRALSNEPGHQEMKAWLMRRISADGLSSSRPIALPGCATSATVSCEDKMKSRRVVFRARTESERKLRRILEELNERGGER